jgi:hypothetical protein
MQPSGDESAFQWTAAKRERLVSIYVSTWDLANVWDAIGVRPSEYFRELERNAGFARVIDEAESRADEVLERRATELALQGQDCLFEYLQRTGRLRLRVEAPVPPMSEEAN